MNGLEEQDLTLTLTQPVVLQADFVPLEERGIVDEKGQEPDRPYGPRYQKTKAGIQ